ncbi:MAG: peptidoglycan-associated lipoprotein Pal [Pseudomonadota bacterium]
MKPRRFLSLMAVVTLTALLLGCSSTPKTAGGEDGATGAAGGYGGSGSGGSGGSGADIRSGPDGAGNWAANALNDPNSPLSKRVIYFEFDSSDIRSDFLPVLRIHAKFLNTNKGMVVNLEGHCDERGSREYNLALGERRSNAVKRFLQAEGVPSGQLNGVSYGSERPADPGHSEASWSQNRRVELAY